MRPKRGIMPKKIEGGAAGRSRSSITVNVALTPVEDQKAPNVRAYLFDRAGRLVDSRPATKSVTFKVDPRQDYRVTVGPDLLKDEKPRADLAAQLVKAKAVTQDSPAQLAQEVLNFNIHHVI